MGSYCSTLIDAFEVWSSKSYVDEDSLTLFQERDRAISTYVDPDDEDAAERQRVVYSISAAEMCDRLDAMGFDLERARQSYNAGRGSYVELQSEWYAEVENEPLYRKQQREVIERVKGRDFDWWSAAVAKLVPLHWNIWRTEAFAHIPESEAFHEMEGLSGFFADGRLYLRAMLHALPHAQRVTLDISELVASGYYNEHEPICDNARALWAASNPIYGPIVILTEGKLDSRVLNAAFETMSPHLADYFGFLDFEGTVLPGSADNLSKMVKAFVAAKLSSRVIAVFDNDTAGLEALDGLAQISLPPNIKAISLPHNTLAEAYPTEGPQGPAVMDVNGSACSIELFFGREALTGRDGNLMPVRWSGYIAKMKRYQGAVEQKGESQKAFFALLKKQTTSEAARAAFPDMARVVDTLAFAFKGPVLVWQDPPEFEADDNL